MFLDDDIIFLKNSFKEMNKLINRYKNNSDVAGFGFNLIDNNIKYENKCIHLLICGDLSLYVFYR